MQSRITPLALACIALLMLNACATQNADLKAPDPTLPQNWTQAPTSSSSSSNATLSHEWWRGFGSNELDALVQHALERSNDVASAVARVRQSEALARQAGAALLPELSASLNAHRQARISGDAAVSGNQFGVGFSASYEVDFWGRNRATSDAALAQWQASVFDRDTVKLSMAARVAEAWLQTQALHERQRIAERNLANAQRLLRWLESRAKAGSASALELAQQRGLVASQRRNIAALQQQMSQAQSTLSVLLSEPVLPPSSQAEWGRLTEPPVTAGLPSQLLTRRPDIARAEAQLAAAHANVVAARAAMLPSLTLSAGIAAGGRSLGSAFDHPLYTLAANLAAPIFNAGRLQAGADLAYAQREELLANYRQSIVAAFADADVALQAVDQLQSQNLAQGEVLAQAERALTLAERRHAAGAETLLVLLDAQRSLYAAQDEAVQLKLASLQTRVALFKALGGGWTLPAP